MIVAHLDLDAFFAAVEELEDPSLRARPLVVGGDPHGRGVVATANYVAREYGIQSAMSCAEALRRCPQAVFVRPRHSLYRDYSRSVWDSVRAIVPTVERTGLDEGYLDLGEVAPDFLRARALAEAVQTAVRGTTRLTCSLGVASSKVVAKVASDRRKPGGITVVSPGREREFLGPLAVRKLPGVGPRSAERLARVGIETVGALGDARRRDVAHAHAGQGRPHAARPRARHRSAPARDATSRGSRSRRRRRSLGTSTTARACTTSCAGWRTSLADHLRRHGQAGRTVTTKVRYPDFSIRTRSLTLDVAVDDAETIGDVACRLLDRALADRPGALRLVGVGVKGLEDRRARAS